MADPQYIDAEQFSGSKKEPLTFQQIVLEHFKRILTFCSVEWKGGFTIQRSKSIAGGGIVQDEMYVPDTREVFINATNALDDILHPHYDNEMSKHIPQIYKKFDALDSEVDKTKPNDEKRHIKLKLERVKVARELLIAISAFLFRAHYLSAKKFQEEVK